MATYKTTASRKVQMVCGTYRGHVSLGQGSWPSWRSSSRASAAKAWVCSASPPALAAQPPVSLLENDSQLCVVLVKQKNDTCNSLSGLVYSKLLKAQIELKS